MKEMKLIRIAAAMLLILSLMSVTAFGANAVEVPEKITIVGWEQWCYYEEMTEEGIDKVIVNGKEFPKDGKLEFDVVDGEQETITVEVYLKNGFVISEYVETGISLVNTEDGHNNFDSGDPYSSTAVMKLPNADSFYNEDTLKYRELFILIPIEKDAAAINIVDLDIKAPKAGTVVTADYDSENKDYDWDTQDPFPVISVPDDADYELYDSDSDYLPAYWIETPSFNTDLYVNGEDKPCIEGGDTLYAGTTLIAKEGFYFSNSLRVNVTGGEFEDVDVDEIYAWVILSTEVEKENVPETGDKDTTVLWLVISAASIAGVVALELIRRKKVLF